eukprot:TRINITY_DN4444_c0_g1_i1.p1 TRINITY_DN4444_c0_g1~~TRINITY_DN4444_c0_g1_i1.p1  ORF type:complete len:340 (+),score=68.94 TRINITY_DN4444_c0_g1_i1:582-1601(+)
MILDLVYGLSTMMMDGDFLKTSCGSPNYAAPEVISGKLYAGPEVDVWSCGVILYTLLCARLPFDDEYIPSLFKKIRAGVFDTPSHVSASCKDLISQMLVVDPLKRITIEEIKNHPWFQINLPRYLTYPSQNSPQRTQDIDQEILREITEKFMVDKETVIEALLSTDSKSFNLANEFQVAYNLIYDNQKLYTDKMPTSNLSSSLFATSPPLNLREETPFDFEENKFDTPELKSKPLVYYDPIFQRRWALGTLSSLPPNIIMQKLFAALKETGNEWKITGPFALRCRHRVGQDKYVKFALQVYKVKEKRYLVDIKKIEEGETFHFFDICSKLLSQLDLAGN